MGRPNEKEFYLEALRLNDSKDVAVAKKWWGVFCEVIKRNLYYGQYCNLPGLGHFDCRHVDEYIQEQTDPKTGGKVHYLQPERYVPVWHNADDFINDINGRAVTIAARRRAKNNILSQRDYERMRRMQQLEEENNVLKKMIEASQKAHKESGAFEALLAKKLNGKNGEQDDVPTENETGDGES